jgi:hypothetical protein
MNEQELRSMIRESIARQIRSRDTWRTPPSSACRWSAAATTMARA